MTTKNLPRCEYPTCAGHLGKFSDCMAEALYDAGDGDQTTGSTEFGEYFQVFHVTEPYTVEDFDNFTIPVGTYHLFTDSQGFVTYATYPLHDEEAALTFTNYNAAYSRWLEASDV